MVRLTEEDMRLARQMADRMATNGDADPTTGADLGAGPGAGTTKAVNKEKRSSGTRKN